ncbi:MAG: ABC transporter permease subunit [Acidobacteriota bacterium]|nr:ABC transporter permease subunit [Acidobacteriota bacterium]
MIGTIAKKEIVNNLLSYKFFIVILLASVLIFTSLFVMARDYKARLADYQINKPAAGEAIAVLPPNPLSILAKGLDESMARSIGIGVTGFDVQSGQKSGNVIYAFFPAPDFVYIVKLVMSLVALLFGFDQISREKEDGTLKLALSNSVSRSALLAGKWLGNFFSLAVPFTIVTCLGIALVGLDPAIRLSAGHLGRMAWLVALSLVYIALFLSLGFLVSALTQRSASSLVVLLLLWAGLVFVLPNLGTLAARQIVKVPSTKALSEKRQQIWTSEILKTYTKEGKWREGTWNDRILAINRESNRLEEDYRRQADRLVRLSKTINRISPAAGFVYAATDIAGTGIGEDSRLKEDIIRHKNRIVDDIIGNKRPFPAFTYRYRSLGRVLAEGSLIDIAWLLAAALIVFGVGAAALRRYDVR